MINYSKVRESVQKNSSKKSLGRGPSANNKSHTSSINIKLSQDACTELSKIPMRTMLKDKTEVALNKHYQPLQTQHKKYSVKLQSNQKENQGRRKDNAPYDLTIFRPFQQTNRYLETQRIPKDIKTHERTPVKQVLRLRTEYPEQKVLRTDYTETTPQTFKKQNSTKHTTENQNGVMRISAHDLKNLMSQLVKEQKQVAELRRQLQFYRLHARNTLNPVLCALKI